MLRLKEISTTGYAMKYVIRCFLLSFFVISLSCSIPGNSVDTELVSIAKIIGKRKNIKMAAYGASGPSASIPSLFLGFDIVGEKSKDELRQILLECLIEFIELLNMSDFMKNAFKVDAFESKTLSLHLYVYDNAGEIVRYPKIGIVKINDGIISYINVSPKSDIKYTSVQKENINQALKLISFD